MHFTKRMMFNKKKNDAFINIHRISIYDPTKRHVSTIFRNKINDISYQ